MGVARLPGSLGASAIPSSTHQFAAFHSGVDDPLRAPMESLGGAASRRPSWRGWRDPVELTLPTGMVNVDRITTGTWSEASNLPEIGQDRAEQWLDPNRILPSDPGVVAKANGYLGVMESDRANYDTARDLLTSSIKDARDARDRRREAYPTSMIGRIDLFLGDLDSSAHLLTQAIRSRSGRKLVWDGTRRTGVDRTTGWVRRLHHIRRWGDILDTGLQYVHFGLMCTYGQIADSSGLFQ